MAVIEARWASLILQQSAMQHTSGSVPLAQARAPSVPCPNPTWQPACTRLSFRSYNKCGGFIQQHRKGIIELAPGCDADQSLESAVTGVLNNIREQAAKVLWGREAGNLQ